MPVAHARAVRAELGQHVVEPVGQVLLAVVAVVILGPRGQRLCSQVEVERLAQGDAARTCPAALLVRVESAPHADQRLPGGVSGLLGVHRRVVAQLRSDLSAVDEGLHVEAALGGGHDEVEPPHLGVGVQGRLARLGAGRPIDEGLGDLRLHAGSVGGRATARTRFRTTRCRVQTRRKCP